MFESFLFPSKSFNNQYGRKEHIMTPEATLPSIILLGPESLPVPKTISSASFFSAYSTIAITMDAGVTMTFDLSLHPDFRPVFNISENTFELRFPII